MYDRSSWSTSVPEQLTPCHTAPGVQGSLPGTQAASCGGQGEVTAARSARSTGSAPGGAGGAGGEGEGGEGGVGGREGGRGGDGQGEVMAVLV